MAPTPPAVDLLEATARLVGVASPSHEEAALADLVEADLRRHPHLRVDRVGDNVVARTELGRATRVVLAGHLDTVPANGNETPRIEGDVLWGLGSSDMKGGLAVFLALAEHVPDPVHDVTYVFYTAEEVASVHSGLGHLFREAPHLVAGDVAFLGEPTDGAIEAGCQGTARVVVTMRGARAHTARPWMGRNAIHRLGAVLERVAEAPAREPVIDGCRYRESVQAVAVSGGVAGNVVPDEASVTINLRIAPDRTVTEAVDAFRALIADRLDDGDTIELVEASDPAPPGLTHPVLRRLVDHGVAVSAKLGWTDVARFAAHGIPACNLGAGDALVAHTAEEHLYRDSIDRTFATLWGVLTDESS